MRIRAVAVLIEDDRVVLIERHRAGRHYFSFPGGGVETGETPEQAVVREMYEETGLRVAVLRKIADVWFRGNRQEFFLVETVGGQFGTGTGEEFQDPPPPGSHSFGTYHPLWMPIAELLENPVLPLEMAERVQRSRGEGWPAEPFEILETVD